MSKQWKPGRTIVEPRPSRIRRDPSPPPAKKGINPYPTEREIWTVVIGVTLFALALAIITIGFSEITSR